MKHINLCGWDTNRRALIYDTETDEETVLQLRKLDCGPDKRHRTIKHARLALGAQVICLCWAYHHANRWLGDHADAVYSIEEDVGLFWAKLSIGGDEQRATCSTWERASAWIAAQIEEHNRRCDFNGRQRIR